MRHKRTYEMLKDLGHSPVKAAEIVLDASRGIPHAIAWVKLIARMRRERGKA